MDTAKAKLIQSGQDSQSSAKNLHQNLAASVSQATGDTVLSSQLAPPQDQHPLDDQTLGDKPGFELDLEDIQLGMEGKPRTEPSKNFLVRVLERIKKKHPQGEVIKE